MPSDRGKIQVHIRAQHQDTCLVNCDVQPCNVSKRQQILFACKVKVLHVFIFNNVQESGFADGKLYKNIHKK